MRPETWLARLVFTLGTFVMIATSAPHEWGESASATAELQSEGQGDDKLVRVRARLTGGLARDVRNYSVRMSGAVDRPASDLTITWSDTGTALSDGGVPQAFSTSDDFLTVSTYIDRAYGCYSGGDGCEMVFEGRIATESSEAYAMMLAVEVMVRGSKEKQPGGELEVSVEVRDAPQVLDAP